MWRSCVLSLPLQQDFPDKVAYNLVHRRTIGDLKDELADLSAKFSAEKDESEKLKLELNERDEERRRTDENFKTSLKNNSELVGRL